MKLSAFDVLDAARDVQLKVESAQYRIQGEPAKINRYIQKKPMWYYQHKFAQRIPNNCEYDKKIVQEHVDKLELAFKKFADADTGKLFKATIVGFEKEIAALKVRVAKLIKAEKEEPKKPIVPKFKPKSEDPEDIAMEKERYDRKVEKILAYKPDVYINR